VVLRNVFICEIQTVQLAIALSVVLSSNVLTVELAGLLFS